MTRATSSIPDEMDLSFDPLPNSKKTYLPGKEHPQLRVPQREIGLSPTVVNGVETPNEPLRIYDTSGPYTDPDVEINIAEQILRFRQVRVIAVQRLEDGASLVISLSSSQSPGQIQAQGRRVGCLHQAAS